MGSAQCEPQLVGTALAAVTNSNGLQAGNNPQPTGNLLLQGVFSLFQSNPHTQLVMAAISCIAAVLIGFLFITRQRRAVQQGHASKSASARTASQPTNGHVRLPRSLSIRTKRTSVEQNEGLQQPSEPSQSTLSSDSSLEHVFSNQAAAATAVFPATRLQSKHSSKSHMQRYWGHSEDVQGMSCHQEHPDINTHHRNLCTAVDPPGGGSPAGMNDMYFTDSIHNNSVYGKESGDITEGVQLPDWQPQCPDVQVGLHRQRSFSAALPNDAAVPSTWVASASPFTSNHRQGFGQSPNNSPSYVQYQATYSSSHQPHSAISYQGSMLHGQYSDPALVPHRHGLNRTVSGPAGGGVLHRSTMWQPPAQQDHSRHCQHSYSMPAIRSESTQAGLYLGYSDHLHDDAYTDGISGMPPENYTNHAGDMQGVGYADGLQRHPSLQRHSYGQAVPMAAMQQTSPQPMRRHSYGSPTSSPRSPTVRVPSFPGVLPNSTASPKAGAAASINAEFTASGLPNPYFRKPTALASRLHQGRGFGSSTVESIPEEPNQPLTQNGDSPVLVPEGQLLFIARTRSRLRRVSAPEGCHDTATYDNTLSNAATDNSADTNMGEQRQVQQTSVPEDNQGSLPVPAQPEAHDLQAPAPQRLLFPTAEARKVVDDFATVSNQNLDHNTAFMHSPFAGQPGNHPFHQQQASDWQPKRSVSFRGEHASPLQSPVHTERRFARSASDSASNHAPADPTATRSPSSLPQYTFDQLLSSEVSVASGLLASHGWASQTASPVNIRTRHFVGCDTSPASPASECGTPLSLLNCHPHLQRFGSSMTRSASDSIAQLHGSGLPRQQHNSIAFLPTSSSQPAQQYSAAEHVHPLAFQPSPHSPAANQQQQYSPYMHYMATQAGQSPQSSWHHESHSEASHEWQHSYGVHGTVNAAGNSVERKQRISHHSTANFHNANTAQHFIDPVPYPIADPEEVSDGSHPPTPLRHSSSVPRSYSRTRRISAPPSTAAQESFQTLHPSHSIPPRHPAGFHQAAADSFDGSLDGLPDSSVQGFQNPVALPHMTQDWPLQLRTQQLSYQHSFHADGFSPRLSHVPPHMPPRVFNPSLSQSLPSSPAYHQRRMHGLPSIRQLHNSLSASSDRPHPFQQSVMQQPYRPYPDSPSSHPHTYGQLSYGSSPDNAPYEAREASHPLMYMQGQEQLNFQPLNEYPSDSSQDVELTGRRGTPGTFNMAGIAVQHTQQLDYLQQQHHRVSNSFLTGGQPIRMFPLQTSETPSMLPIPPAVPSRVITTGTTHSPRRSYSLNTQISAGQSPRAPQSPQLSSLPTTPAQYAGSPHALFTSTSSKSIPSPTRPPKPPRPPMRIHTGQSSPSTVHSPQSPSELLSSPEGGNYSATSPLEPSPPPTLLAPSRRVLQHSTSSPAASSMPGYPAATSAPGHAAASSIMGQQSYGSNSPRLQQRLSGDHRTPVAVSLPISLRSNQQSHGAEYANSHSSVPAQPARLRRVSRSLSVTGAILDLDPSEVVIFKDGMLGSGAFGAVYRGNWRGEEVAVKLVNANVVDGQMSESDIDSFQRELSILSTLDHPNIVRLHGGCLRPPTVFIVTQLMAQSLDAVIHKSSEPLPINQVLHWALDVARGLSYLHPGLLHRDLKPANILIDQCGVAKISDFGLARYKAKQYLSTRQPDVGSCAYMAPECFNPEIGGVSAAVDIYGFGVLVWEMLTRDRPWAGESNVSIIYKVAVQKCKLRLSPQGGSGSSHSSSSNDTQTPCPPQLCDLLSACFEHDPHNRPDCAHIIQVLESLLAEVENNEDAHVNRDGSSSDNSTMAAAHGGLAGVAAGQLEVDADSQLPTPFGFCIPDL